MSEVGSSRHDAIAIGQVATPPFVRLPHPETLFRLRAQRFMALADGHPLNGYLMMMAGLCETQHRIQDGLPALVLPDAASLARSSEHIMPVLDRGAFVIDETTGATLDALFEMAVGIGMPEAAHAALGRAATADAEQRAGMVRNVLADSIPVEALAEHVFVAAALQVHFARLASQLDAKALKPVGDGACPTCGGPPASSLIVGWENAHGTRFCACSLCGTLWNYVRVKCVLCGSTGGIAYEEIADGPGFVKAETCDACRCYVKILHQHKDPALDPVADDVATLSLDLMMDETEYRRGGVNPFLLGY